MAGFISLVLLIALLVLWRVLSRRIEELQRKIDVLWSRSGEPLLVERVQTLEKAVEELQRQPSSTRRVAPSAMPIAAPPPLPAKPSPVAEPTQRWVPRTSGTARRIEAPPRLPVTPPPAPVRWCTSCGKALPSPSALCECQRKPIAPRSRNSFGTKEPKWQFRSPRSRPLRHRFPIASARRWRVKSGKRLSAEAG